MRRFTSILLIADGHADASAFQRAGSAARRDAASLCVMDVVRPPPGSLPVPGLQVAEIQGQIIARRREALRDLIGGSAAVEIRVGIPFIEIIRKVMRDGHDLVMKAPEGGGEEGLFGSTDLHLLRKCPCPVWMVNPAGGGHRGPILAAVDLDAADATARSLNATIMELALSRARNEGSELHVIHAWGLFGESMLRGGRAGVDLGVALSQVRDYYQHELGALVRRHDVRDVDLHTHLIKGEPERVIPALAEREGIDLIVMGTVVRTGIPGFLIGNTAEKILGTVRCSVLALKPEGFETPVQLDD